MYSTMYISVQHNTVVIIFYYPQMLPRCVSDMILFLSCVVPFTLTYRSLPAALVPTFESPLNPGTTSSPGTGATSGTATAPSTGATSGAVAPCNDTFPWTACVEV